MQLEELLALHHRKLESRPYRGCWNTLWLVVLVVMGTTASCYTFLVAKKLSVMLTLLSVHTTYTGAMRCFVYCFYCLSEHCCWAWWRKGPFRIFFLPQFFPQVIMDLIHLSIYLACVSGLHLLETDPWPLNTFRVSSLLHVLFALVVQMTTVKSIWNAFQAMRSVIQGEYLLSNSIEPALVLHHKQTIVGKIRQIVNLQRNMIGQTATTNPSEVLNLGGQISLSFTYRIDRSDLAVLLKFPV